MLLDFLRFLSDKWRTIEATSVSLPR